jgi:hypothetical protein
MLSTCGWGKEKLKGMVEEFWGILNYGTRLLQISRSTPYVSTALIGHKQVCAQRPLQADK